MARINLQDLFSEFPLQVLDGIVDSRLIHGITVDSRMVNQGDLFVATLGKRYNAHRFIPQAVAAGAAAVVGMEDGVSIDVPYVRVENSRLALAHLSAAFFRFPARKLTVIGVTGTDGKTTTCNLIYEILLESSIPSGMISTVNAVFGDGSMDTGYHVTTPDAPVLQGYLAKMVSQGLTHVVLETTSHGWAQHRVDGCEFDIGVVTNITHEHLDEHGSFEKYLEAKARLFESLNSTTSKKTGNPRLAVLNKDDTSYSILKTVSPDGYLTYSLTGNADVTADEINLFPTGSNFTARGPGWDIPVRCHFPGEYNISNCLAAMTASINGLGIDPDYARQGISNLSGIPGRMEPIDLGQDFNAIVDFAHTPNALKNSIQTVRSFTPGRVITVFGSAGLRDREKRRMMAEVSATGADVSILTAEDPRTEHLDDILGEMAEGVRSKGGKEGVSFWCKPDRREAIRFGVKIAKKGDTVMACGKGHEQSMCFGEVEYPWDDRTAMRAALSELMEMPGPEMPWLPEF